MVNKKLMILLVFCFISVVSLAGQAEAAAKPAFDNSIISMENGFVFGYNFATGLIGQAQEIGVDFSLGANISAGFVYLSGNGTSFLNTNLFRINYYLFKQAGISLFLGRYDVSPCFGTNIFIGFLNQQISGIKTAIDLKLGFLANSTTGLSGGIIVSGISVKIGI